MFKRTPFFNFHNSAGATFRSYEEFQYELPEHFGSVRRENEALMHDAVCIDFSFHGCLRLSGRHALDFLNRMSTNDLKNLQQNECLQTVLTTDKGRIVDLISVYRSDNDLVVSTSPQNEDTILRWFDKYIIMDDVRMEIATDHTAQLVVVGPRSSQIVRDLIKTDPPENNRSLNSEFQGHPLLIGTSFQIENGFILITDLHGGESLLEWFRSKNILSCGMEVYHSARIAQRKPILRRELSEKYNPLEAGLSHAVSFTKGCYIGQEVVARLDSYQKVQRHLVLIRTSDQVSTDCKIKKNNSEAGSVTSSCYSENLGQFISLGYVKTEFTSSSGPWTIDCDDRVIQAEIYP